jgi:hypothetical protein
MRPRVANLPLVVATKYANNAPVPTGCCMACRSCVTTNLLGLAIMPALAVASAFRRRFAASPRKD